MMATYQELVRLHTINANRYRKQYRLISLIRLAIAAAIAILLISYFQTGNWLFLIGSIALLIAFIVCMAIHQKVALRLQLEENLQEINEAEWQYIAQRKMSYNDGVEYIDKEHDYSYDLDIFGSGSLYQHLNRTATRTGNLQLAKALLTLLPNKAIECNQQAIKELSEKLQWRQQVYAMAKIAKDSEKEHTAIINWAAANIKEVSVLQKVISICSPVALIACFLISLLGGPAIFSYIASLIFIFNLAFLFSQYKTILKEVDSYEKVGGILHQFSCIIKKITAEAFTSVKLNDLKQTLTSQHGDAATEINRLARLFNSMSSIYNGLAVLVFNGLFLYHIHIFHSLLRWKKKHALHIPLWLSVIGEFEVLNSFANFAYNNPGYAYPGLNTTLSVDIRQLGHPLIDKNKSVTNDIVFHPFKFIILTGSNMSGKSTFLRALGINMVLTGAGAPVCATQADIHPMQVLVSMRLSDSLNENESYFFAEVRRLKEIMMKIDAKPSLVLLDEILKGTNSEDKRSGTLGILHKLIGKNIIGALATHDLEICELTNSYPQLLANKCFEASIENNHLKFDYVLRDGICKNKSATFLMQQMDLI